MAASPFAYAYKLLAWSHKLDPFCYAALITSSTFIQYAISTDAGTKMKRVWHVRLICLSKKSQVGKLDISLVNYVSNDPEITESTKHTEQNCHRKSSE